MADVSLRTILPSKSRGDLYSNLGKSTYLALGKMIIKSTRRIRDFRETYRYDVYQRWSCNTTNEEILKIERQHHEYFILPHINRVFYLLLSTRELMSKYVKSKNTENIRRLLRGIQYDVGMVNRDFYDGCLRNIIVQSGCDTMTEEEWDKCKTAIKKKKCKKHLH